jgi:2-dehydro-3-deoxygluconokinase
MSEPRFDVTTIGEMLLRLSVPSGERLEATNHLDMHPAGAEANVATLLARLGRRTCWFGALPENPLGRLAANALRDAGVDSTGIIQRTHGRLGTYYVEFGEAPRGIQVTYDRAHSCAAELDVNEIDWDSLRDTRLLHLTGITPALSPSCAEVVTSAVQKAKNRGVQLSFDINYRQKLWSEEKAAQALAPLIQNVEILFCSQTDAIRLFHCSGPSEEIVQRMLELSHAHHVILTRAEKGVLLWDGQKLTHEGARPTQIIDRLGAGDALASGVIHGWLDGDITSGLRYGVTLAAMALSQRGDMVITNKAELLALSQQSSTLTR